MPGLAATLDEQAVNPRLKQRVHKQGKHPMNILKFWSFVTAHLERTGYFLAPLGLRIILAWEFFEAGLMKYNGSNWFVDILDSFPFPFNVIPPEFSWWLATYTELFGGVAILLGLGTRFFSASLMILTIVATAAVHWPAEWNSLAELLQGYSVSDHGYGNYKLPVIYLVMFLPLLFHGAGKLSMDRLIASWLQREAGTRGFNPATAS
jgi:putative oxidoreductase